MIINSINSFNQFKQIQNPFVCNFRINNSQTESKLSPLKKDTVSFSSSAKLSGENMLYAPNARACKQVYDNARPAAYYLEKVLNKYLEPINQNSKKNKPLITVTTRTKSPGSIRDKVASKFNKIVKNESEKFADAAVTEIFKYYSPQEGFTEEMAKIQAKILMDFLNSENKIPPYNNELFYLAKITKDLEDNNLIKFNSKNIDRLTVFSEMENELHNITSNKHCDKNGAYLDSTTISGTKHYANDIIGGRIILNDASKETVEKVFTALRQAAEDGVINITSIENNIPSTDKMKKGKKISDYEYISSRKLKNFANNTQSEYIENESKSGYLAIHVNLDLTSDILKSKKNEFNGYQGEIQIIDANIEDLKEIEDLCYKLKDNKNNIGKEYTTFKNHFKKYYKMPDVKEAFNKYTYDLYLNQREKSAKKNKKDINHFSTIDEMGYGDILPKELDYNLLKDIKGLCERSNKETDKDIKTIYNMESGFLTSDAPKRFMQTIFNLGLSK